MDTQTALALLIVAAAIIILAWRWRRARRRAAGPACGSCTQCPQNDAGGRAKVLVDLKPLAVKKPPSNKDNNG